jgi:hypothetical protein
VRDSYRQVLVVASAAALTDALLKMPGAAVVTLEAASETRKPVNFQYPPGDPRRYAAAALIEPIYYKAAPTRPVDRDKPWRRWPVRR